MSNRTKRETPSAYTSLINFGRLSTIRKLTWKHLTGSSDDDWVEKMNHKATVAILILFAVFATSGQYIKDPIHCWCPAFFTGEFVAYTKNYCWIANTYFLPMLSEIPSNIVARRDNPIVYYQWVPFILLIQALLFKLPYFVWHLMSQRSGINMSKLCTMIDSVQFQQPEKRDEQVKQIARYIHRWLLDRRVMHMTVTGRLKQKLSRVLVFCLGQRHGHFLTGVYMCIKLLYCINGVSQFFLLNAFLAIDYWLYGYERFLCMFTECPELRDSGTFPRVTLCDFEIRQLQNLQRHTVQCVLPFNIINEKLFAIIWLWVFVLAILNVGDFFSSLYQFLVKHNRVLYVRRYLRAGNEIGSRFDKKLAKKFANSFLRNDGCFVLRIVNKNTTDMFLSDVLKELWYLYRDTHNTDAEGFPVVKSLPSAAGEFDSRLDDLELGTSHGIDEKEDNTEIDT